jgi:hypothetical protein
MPCHLYESPVDTRNGLWYVLSTATLRLKVEGMASSKIDHHVHAMLPEFAVWHAYMFLKLFIERRFKELPLVVQIESLVELQSLVDVHTQRLVEVQVVSLAFVLLIEGPMSTTVRRKATGEEVESLRYGTWLLIASMGAAGALAVTWSGRCVATGVRTTLLTW